MTDKEIQKLAEKDFPIYELHSAQDKLIISKYRLAYIKGFKKCMELMNKKESESNRNYLM